MNMKTIDDVLLYGGFPTGHYSMDKAPELTYAQRYAMRAGDHYGYKG